MATATTATIDSEVYANIVNVGMEIWMAELGQRQMERTRMESTITSRKRARLESRKRARLESIIPTAMAANSNFTTNLGKRERQRQRKRER